VHRRGCALDAQAFGKLQRNIKRISELPMPAGRPGLIRRFFGFLWRTLDFSRRMVLNLLFLAVIVIVVAAWLHDGRPTLTDKTVLVVEIKGPIVEQYTGAAGEAALAQMLLERERETQLRDLLTAMDAAAKDERIARVLLMLDDFEGAGMPTLREGGGQAGGGLGLVIRPTPVLPGGARERGLSASARHGVAARLWRLSQLLP
jgi:hypothetical protein